MKEHLSSKWSFGHALRKYGRENFVYEFEYFNTVDEALSREAELVTLDGVKSKTLYNETVGGCLTNVLTHDNPMHKQSVIDVHPGLWTTDNNPMNNPDSKKKMIESQNRKKISVDGVVYDGVREAARILGHSRQFVAHRLKSKNFPGWYYIK
jgi:hypothetical protein